MNSGHGRCVSAKPWLGAIAAALTLFALVQKPAMAQTTMRPLSDFIDAQQVAGNGSPYIDWTDPTTNRVMVIDYAGKINDYIVAHGGTGVGTTISGTVMQRALKDGKAEITVLLHLQHAIVYAYQGSSLVFGHTQTDILSGSDPALATVNFTLKFTISAPGAPLNDLSTIVFSQHAEVFQQLNAIGQGTFRAAYGVADGTPGIAQTTQTGTLQSQGNGGPRGDHFPAEHIDFHVLQQ